MFCSNCGYNIPDNTAFCPSCGHPVPQEDTPPVMRCSVCGAELEPDSAFCDECGTRVSHQPSEPASPQQEIGFQQTAVMPQPVMQPPQHPQQAMAQPQPFNAQAPQPSYGQPVPNQPYGMAPQGQPVPPKKKSKTPLVVGIVAALAVVVIALVVIFVVKPFGGGENNGNENANSNTVEQDQNAQPQEDHNTQPQENQNAEPQANQNAQPPQEQNAEPQQNQNAQPPQNTEPFQNAEPKPEPAPAIPPAASVSTVEVPTLGDFTWYSSSQGEVPAGAIRIESCDDVLGSWKAYMFGDSGMERLFNIEIKGSAASATMVCNWKYVTGNGMEGMQEEAGSPPSSFVGTFANGGIDGTGPGRLTMRAFWIDNGRECAVGEFIWPSGEHDTVLLARP